MGTEGGDTDVLMETASPESPHSLSWLYPANHLQLLADSSPVPSPMWSIGSCYMPPSHNSSPHSGMSATAGEHGPGGAHPRGPSGTPAHSGSQRPGGTGPHGRGGPGPGRPGGRGEPHARRGGRRRRPRHRYRPYKPTISHCCLCTVGRCVLQCSLETRPLPSAAFSKVFFSG